MPDGTSCPIPECGRPRDCGGRSLLCATHSRRKRIYGDPLAGPPILVRTPATGFCAVEGCDRPAASNGRAVLCGSHGRRKRQYGDPLAGPVIRPMLPTGGPCPHDGCTRPVRSGGLCGTHYQRLIEGRQLDSMYARNKGNLCSADDCDRPSTRRELCEKHYRRLMRVENGDQIRATQAAWREANREHITALYADWEKRNPEKVSLRDRRNKVRRRIVIGSPDPVNYERILAEHGMTCHICGEPIESFGDLHFDHVIPLGGGHGGAHSAANIRPSHKTCNLRKGIKLMSQLSGEVMKTE